MTDLTQLSITEALEKLDAGVISSVELTRAYLDRIAAVDGEIGAYLTVSADSALAAAEAADQQRAAGQAPALCGIPVAIKDVISTRDIETTAGSQILKGYVPLFSATVVERLQAAGAVILGKLNMDEFAMGSTTENSAYKRTRNPWNTEHVPGGSSGGSAAAVAARMAPAALGTDTGGSIRQPGAHCNVTALKPSYGRLSRYGLIAYGSSLDCAGPLGQSVEDVARLLQVMAGHDPLDSTCVDVPVPDYHAALTGDIKGLKIGIPAEYFVEGIQPEVAARVREAIAQLEQAGAEIVEVSLPHTEYSVPTYYIVSSAEASANLARYDGIRFGQRVDKSNLVEMYKATRGEGFGAEVKRRIIIGTYVLSAGYYDSFYGKAQAVRTLIKQDFDKVFEQVDVLAAPVAPTTAPRFGANADNPMQMYLEDVLTLPASLAGVTGLNVPCGFDDAGLPVGLQLIGPAFGEEVVLRVGHAYQQLTDWHTQRPAQ